MKKLQLTVEDHLYDTLLEMLKGFPRKDIEIIEDQSILSERHVDKASDINQFAGKIKSFSAIKDPIAWQREIRSEWDREWDK